MKEIFRNFRRFIFQASINTCPLIKTDSDGKELLSIFQMFWHQKFVPLGIKVFVRRLLKEKRELVEKRFRFLDRFFNNDPQVQIIWEYKRLRQDIQNDLKSKFSTKCFSFLTQHLHHRLSTLPGPEFLDDLEWLASQSQLFLTFFFYFLFCQDLRGEIPPRYNLKDPQLMLDRVGSKSILLFINLNLEEKKFLIFSKRSFDSNEEQAEAVRLVRLILNKLGMKIDLQGKWLTSFT